MDLILIARAMLSGSFPAVLLVPLAETSPSYAFLPHSMPVPGALFIEKRLTL